MDNLRLLIVGAGPAGIATAVEVKIAGLNKTLILEKTDHICDTIVRLYPKAKRVDPFYHKTRVKPLGVLSFDTMSKEEFLDFIQEIVKF